MSNISIFHIEGGVGKHVMFLSVVSKYRSQNPDKKIIVVCAWPEIFLNNPNVDRVYRIGNTPYFYKDFIYEKNVEIFAQEPYKTTSHITKKTHLIESWCNMIGLDIDKQTENLSKLYINHREMEQAANIIKSFNFQKPLLIFQPFGGPGKPNQQTEFSWTRDIHPDIAQILVHNLKESFDILHVCYDLHPHLDGVFRFEQQIPKRVLFSLLAFSHKRLLVDSSLQHAAANMGLPSTVVWVATQPVTFGYAIHNNILPKTSHPQGTVDSYLYDYNFNGPPHECPYESYNDIFDVQTILNAL